MPELAGGPQKVMVDAMLLFLPKKIINLANIRFSLPLVLYEQKYLVFKGYQIYTDIILFGDIANVLRQFFLYRELF